MACLFFIQGGTFPEVAGTFVVAGVGTFPGGFIGGGTLFDYLFFIQGGTFPVCAPPAGGLVWGPGGLFIGGGGWVTGTPGFVVGWGIVCGCCGCCGCYVLFFIHGGTFGEPPGGLFPSACFFQGF